MWLEDLLGGISLGNLSEYPTKQFCSRWKYSTANKPSHPIPPPSPLRVRTCDPLERAVSGAVEWDSEPIGSRSSQTATHETTLPSLLSPTTFCKVAVMRREKKVCSNHIKYWLISAIFLFISEKINIFRCQMLLKDLALGGEHHLAQCETWP